MIHVMIAPVITIRLNFYNKTIIFKQILSLYQVFMRLSAKSIK